MPRMQGLDTERCYSCAIHCLCDILVSINAHTHQIKPYHCVGFAWQGFASGGATEAALVRR